uniref:Uncharacterized protein n=1 Tax=Plectus sambesii TaxID=2011161 RepID=A0A914XK70_9BILA
MFLNINAGHWRKFIPERTWDITDAHEQFNLYTSNSRESSEGARTLGGDRRGGGRRSFLAGYFGAPASHQLRAEASRTQRVGTPVGYEPRDGEKPPPSVIIEVGRSASTRLQWAQQDGAPRRAPSANLPAHKLSRPYACLSACRRTLWLQSRLPTRLVEFFFMTSSVPWYRNNPCSQPELMASTSSVGRRHLARFALFIALFMHFFLSFIALPLRLLPPPLSPSLRLSQSTAGGAGSRKKAVVVKAVVISLERGRSFP